MTERDKAYAAMLRYIQAEADWQGNITCAAFAEKYGLPKPRTMNEITEWLAARRTEALALAMAAS